MLVTCCVFPSSLITGYVDALKQMIEERIDRLTAFKGKATECTAALLGINFPTTQYYNPNLTDTGLVRVRVELLELNFYQQQQVDGNNLRE